MKRLLLIFILLSGTAYAQKSSNELVIQFVDDNYEEKIGSGICFEVVDAAGEYLKEFGMNGDTLRVIEDSILPGDVIIMDSLVFDDGSVLLSHIAIIYYVHPAGVFLLAEQNIATKENNTAEVIYGERTIEVEKDSHLDFSLFMLREVVSGEVTFLRF